jgi:hypothetical protein
MPKTNFKLKKIPYFNIITRIGKCKQVFWKKEFFG